MWSQWVCVISMWTRTGFFAAISCRPSSRMPVRASRTTISWPPKTWMQEVFPPYFAVPVPGQGMEPRTPQNLIFIRGRRILQREKGCQERNPGARGRRSGRRRERPHWTAHPLKFPRWCGIAGTGRRKPLYMSPVKIPSAGLILAAAGEGRRLGSRLPKALVPLAGTPLFLHSLRTFAGLPFVREIAIVLPPEWVDRIRKQLGRRLESLKVTTLVPGG